MGVFIINSDIFIGNIVWEYIYQCGVKSGNLFMNIFIQEHEMPVYHFNCFSYWINVGSFKIPDTSLIRWRIDNFKVQLTINNGWRDGWIPQSTIKLAWSVNIRSIQEEEFANKCLGWVINYCKLYELVTESILVPSIVLTSLFHQDFDLALKLPRIIEKSGSRALNSSSNFSKFEIKSLKTVLVRLGDL